jgi:hypothetical protein
MQSPKTSGKAFQSGRGGLHYRKRLDRLFPLVVCVQAAIEPSAAISRNGSLSWKGVAKMNNDNYDPQDKLSIGGALVLAFGASALLYAVFFTIIARI